jgi:hypothetical protein
VTPWASTPHFGCSAQEIGAPYVDADDQTPRSLTPPQTAAQARYQVVLLPARVRRAFGAGLRAALGFGSALGMGR